MSRKKYGRQKRKHYKTRMGFLFFHGKVAVPAEARRLIRKNGKDSFKLVIHRELLLMLGVSAAQAGAAFERGSILFNQMIEERA